MTQPIWDLDHLPKPAPRSDNSDICHPGAAKLSPFPSRRLPRFGTSAHFRQGIVAHHGSTEAFEDVPIRVVGTPGRICFHIPAHAPTIPAPHHLDMCAEGEGRRERRPVGCGCGWAMGRAWNQAMTLACRPRRRARKAGKLFQGLPQVLGGLAGLAGPRLGGLEPTMSGCSRAAPCRQVFPWHQT